MKDNIKQYSYIYNKKDFLDLEIAHIKMLLNNFCEVSFSPSVEYGGGIINILYKSVENPNHRMSYSYRLSPETPHMNNDEYFAEIDKMKNLINEFLTRECKINVTIPVPDRII